MVNDCSLIGQKKNRFCFSSYSELEDVPSQPCLLLIVKWGGQLTQRGRNQAEALGKVTNSNLKKQRL